VLGDASEPDPEAAVDFYGGLFGWEFRDVMPASAEGSYFIARTETRGWSLFDMSGEPRSGNVAAITAMPEGAAPEPRWNTYISVASVDEAATKVHDAGGSVVVEPFDFADAGRTAVFTDADGAAFCVWEARKHKGAQVVNDPGSLNFNGLNIRDTEGAKAFYGSVLGWRTFAMGEPKCGRWTVTATSSRATTPTSATGGRRPGRRPVSRMLWRPSTKSPTTSPTRRRTGA
jgi:predicted enzyme related to lactoylglutathione lyase